MADVIQAMTATRGDRVRVHGFLQSRDFKESLTEFLGKARKNSETPDTEKLLIPETRYTNHTFLRVSGIIALEQGLSGLFSTSNHAINFTAGKNRGFAQHRSVGSFWIAKAHLRSKQIIVKVFLHTNLRVGKLYTLILDDLVLNPPKRQNYYLITSVPDALRQSRSDHGFPEGGHHPTLRARYNAQTSGELH
jgi:hypothetical protein